jgi:RimJ/RimL family protein N-acetyltransferase
MNLTRTRDMGVVRSIMAHPAIWPHVHDDSVVECEPIDHDGFHWMLVDDGAPAGVFLVHAQNSICYQMHTCLLPRIWGAGSARAAQLLLGWAFTETDCQKMVTNVPAYNRSALRFAQAGGMTQEGINRASFLRNGALIDQIMLGITKQEWLCQQQSQS